MTKSSDKKQLNQVKKQEPNKIEEQIIEITRLNHTGEGIGQIDGKIIFIPKTIPGDIVLVEDIMDHHTFYTGTKKRILTPSPNRTRITCPYYEQCGGCHLLGMPYSNQLTYKQEKVKNILKKYANISVNPQIIGGTQYHYRNKITLQVENGTIGLYKINSNTLIPIEECLLISPNMNHLIKIITKIPNLTKIKQIIIREVNHQIMLQFIGKIDKSIAMKYLKQYCTSLYINDTRIFGPEKIEEQLGQYSFDISPRSFFQVNHEQTIKLYNQVRTYLGKNHHHILDLYCGTGSIGIYVSDCATKITGIELNPSSVRDALNNKQKNHLKNIEIKEGDVGKILEASEQYDAIIVDPPRKGLDQQTRNTLLQIKSPTLIYISCNPITLARDLKELQEIYNLTDITLYDLFPNTYHVEVISYMSIKY